MLQSFDNGKWVIFNWIANDCNYFDYLLSHQHATVTSNADKIPTHTHTHNIPCLLRRIQNTVSFLIPELPNFEATEASLRKNLIEAPHTVLIVSALHLCVVHCLHSIWIEPIHTDAANNTSSAIHTSCALNETNGKQVPRKNSPLGMCGALTRNSHPQFQKSGAFTRPNSKWMLWRHYRFVSQRKNISIHIRVSHSSRTQSIYYSI